MHARGIGSAGRGAGGRNSDPGEVATIERSRQGPASCSAREQNRQDEEESVGRRTDFNPWSQRTP